MWSPPWCRIVLPLLQTNIHNYVKKNNCEFYHSKIEKWTHFPQKICKQFAYFWGNERKYFSHIAGLGHLKGPTKKLWAFTFFEVFNLTRSFGSIVEYLQMMLCFTQYVIHWPQMVPKWTGRSIAGPIAHKYWAQGRAKSVTTFWRRKFEKYILQKELKDATWW